MQRFSSTKPRTRYCIYFTITLVIGIGVFILYKRIKDYLNHPTCSIPVIQCHIHYAPYWLNMIEFIESSYINSYIIFFGMTFKKRLWRWGKNLFCKLCCFWRNNRKRPKSYPKYLDITADEAYSDGNVEKICGYYIRIDSDDYMTPYYKSIIKNHKNSHYICYYKETEYNGPIYNTPFSGWIICDENYKEYRNIAIQTSAVGVIEIGLINDSHQLIEGETPLSALFDDEHKKWKIAKCNQWTTQQQPPPIITYLDGKYRKLGFDKIGYAEYVELSQFKMIHDAIYNSQTTIDINGRYRLFIKQKKSNIPQQKMIFVHEENNELTFHYIAQHLVNKWKSGQITEDELGGDWYNDGIIGKKSIVSSNSVSRGSSVGSYKSSVSSGGSRFNVRRFMINDAIKYSHSSVQHELLGVVAYCDKNMNELVNNPQHSTMDLLIGVDSKCIEDKSNVIKKSVTFHGKIGGMNFELMDVKYDKESFGFRITKGNIEYRFAKLLGVILLILGSLTFISDIHTLYIYYIQSIENNDAAYCRWRCYAQLYSNSTNLKQGLVFLCCYASIFNPYNVGGDHYENWLIHLRWSDKILFVIYALNILCFIPIFLVYFIPFSIIYGLPVRIIWLIITWSLKKCQCGRHCLGTIMQCIGNKSITLLWVSTAMGYLLFIYIMILWCVPVMEQIYDDGSNVYFTAIPNAWKERGFDAYFKQTEISETQYIQHIKFGITIFNGIL